MASSTISYPVHYPIGSTIITSTNTNPSSDYGGTWTLVDKEFKRQRLTDTALFTKASAVSSFDNLSVYLGGHEVFIRIRATTNTAIGDTQTSLGKFDLPNMGLSQVIIQFFNGYALRNAVVQLWFANDGTLSVYDEVTRTSGGSLASGSQVRVTQGLDFTYEQMLDSFCDKFYWERTA